MTRSRRRAAAAAVCAAVLAAAAGCSGSPRAVVPEKFCEVPVSEAALAPLLPEHGKVSQTYGGGKNPPGAGCALTVGGRQALAASFGRTDHAPDPVDWSKGGELWGWAPYAEERPVSFPGHAVIGPDRAEVRAYCTSPTSYMGFEIDLLGEKVEDTPTGYKKLLRFVNDFVPNATKKFGCTS